MFLDNRGLRPLLQAGVDDYLEGPWRVAQGCPGLDVGRLGETQRAREMMSDRQRDRESWSELQCDSGNERTHSIKIKVF